MALCLPTLVPLWMGAPVLSHTQMVGRTLLCNLYFHHMVFLQEIILALPVSLTIMAAASIAQLLQRLGLSVALHCVLLQKVTLQQV